MRLTATLTFVLACYLLTNAQQKTITAREIINEINGGRSVTYQNAEIVGELDFTNLDNRREARSAFDWFGWNSRTYESHVEGSVTFINCTFKDDVLAYYNVHDNETFLAHFNQDVQFKNCTFRKASEFKYSEFAGEADFTGTQFERDANFKYAEFSEAPSFAHARFEDDADFKYTEFPRGTSFEGAQFHRLANFKYTKFRTPLNIKDVAFNGSEDFKYTKVDGQSFTSYLLTNR